MRKILVTGANGQLGKTFYDLSLEMPRNDIQWDFKNSNELDITNVLQVKEIFQKNIYDFVINCAAYTNVEKAEVETEKAFLVNAEGVKNLAEICKKSKSTLIHISTDYVFDGKKETPYTEEDRTNPLNVYGKSKLAGEKYIQELLNKYYIIRTSWLYSKFGKNFYTMILEKTKSQENLKITTAQVGSPTNTLDLALFIIEIINIDFHNYGIYNFCGRGESTWYDFAAEVIKNLGNLKIKIEKIDKYPTLAERPKYSVLNLDKTVNNFNFKPKHWKKSFPKCN